MRKGTTGSCQFLILSLCHSSLLTIRNISPEMCNSRNSAFSHLVWKRSISSKSHGRPFTRQVSFAGFSQHGLTHDGHRLATLTQNNSNKSLTTSGLQSLKGIELHDTRACFTSKPPISELVLCTDPVRREKLPSAALALLLSLRIICYLASGKGEVSR